MIGREHFASQFEASVIDLPPGAPDWAFASEFAGSRTLTISVEPWGDHPWTATFSSADPGRRALTALLGTPSPTGLCVIERGTGFLGDVLDPSGFVVVETNGPVVAAEELPHEGKLLLLTRWSITAIGAGGVLWSTARIAVDGLRVDEAGHGWARGVADPDDDEPRDFSLDLASGRLIGGAGVT
jgi:hypothetical protein